MHRKLATLKHQLTGELYDSALVKTLYATDASVYRELPYAVAIPKTTDDIKQLVEFAKANTIPLIPRAAGTSLAGQCVGDGIVVDVSKYMNTILEINTQEQWVRVQPGVVRDHLNAFLKPYGFFFGPIHQLQIAALWAEWLATTLVVQLQLYMEQLVTIPWQ